MVARSKETQGAKPGDQPHPSPQYPPTGGYPTPQYPPPGGYPPPQYPPSPYPPTSGYPTPTYPPPGGYPTTPPYEPPYTPPEGSYPVPPPYKPYERAQGYIETPTPEYLQGWIAADIIEYGGVKPTTIIRTDTDWAIRIYWSLQGLLSPLICGEWCIHCFFESMGPGVELKFPDPSSEIRIPLNPCGDGKYKYDLYVPRGTIGPQHCGTPYKLVVSLTYNDSCYRPGPMAGFVELPMVQFYEPGQSRGQPHTHPNPDPGNPGTPGPFPLP